MSWTKYTGDNPPTETTKWLMIHFDVGPAAVYAPGWEWVYVKHAVIAWMYLEIPPYEPEPDTPNEIWIDKWSVRGGRDTCGTWYNKQDENHPMPKYICADPAEKDDQAGDSRTDREFADALSDEIDEKPETADRWWCCECKRFVEESHRCEQWAHVHKIHDGIIAALHTEWAMENIHSPEELAEIDSESCVGDTVEDSTTSSAIPVDELSEFSPEAQESIKRGLTEEGKPKYTDGIPAA